MKYYYYRILNIILGNLFSRERSLAQLNKLLENNSSPSILFICTGNICRSPFGECYLKSISTHNINIRSAGLDTKEGLNANTVAIEQSKKRGIDLASHKTTVLNEELIEQHDIILIMEPAHLFISALRFPLKTTRKFLLLGLLADSPYTTSLAVDPYGKDSEVFENTFKTIESACNKINELIEK